MRPAVAGDAERFVPLIAEGDADEIRAITGLEPLPAFQWAHANSAEAWAAELERSQEIVALWGATPVDGEDAPIARVWLICSPKVRECPVTFTKMVREQLRTLCDKYGVLWGCGDERNPHHLEWVKRLGFRFVRTRKDVGADRHTFYEFVGTF